MTWNNRVVRHTRLRADVDGRIDYSKEPEEWFAIHEVFYNDRNEIISMTENAIPAIGNTFEDLKGAFNLQKLAFEKEVINDRDLIFYDDIPTLETYNSIFYNFYERFLEDISIQIHLFSWRFSKLWVTRVVLSDSASENFMYKSCKGFIIGPIVITW